MRQSDSWLESGRLSRCSYHFSSTKRNRDNQSTAWCCHWGTTPEKQRQQVKFALIDRLVNTCDYRRKLCQTLIDRAIMKKSCFPAADALCVVTLSGSGGHLTALGGFWQLSSFCTKGDRGRVVVSSIVNQWPLRHPPPPPPTTTTTTITTVVMEYFRWLKSDNGCVSGAHAVISGPLFISHNYS